MAEITDQVLGQNIDTFVQPDASTPAPDKEPDYLNLLVGEGKKYGDNASLAKAYANVEAHAKQVKDENADLRQQLATTASSTKTVDDILAAIKTPVVEPDLVPDNSNVGQLSKEDIQALIAYLRTLPPVTREIPPPRPPADDDCSTYTFWVTESDTPGCS